MKSKGRLTPSDTVRSTTEILNNSHGEWQIVSRWVLCLFDSVIEENGVRLRLNIVDTPGYGDQVNNDRW